MPDEMFVLLGWAWDIDTATRLAGSYPVRLAEIEPLTWARPMISIDPEHASKADLARPLLAVQVPGVRIPLVIDGWHRIHRALNEDVAKLPLILLSEVDERTSRLRGGGITPRR